MAELDERAVVRRLHDRFGFGPRPGDLDQGFDAALERLLTAVPAATPALEPAPQAAPTKDQQAKQDANAARAADEKKLLSWWLGRMVATDTARERLTWFWHGHFATSEQKVRSAMSDAVSMFENFESRLVQVDGAAIFTRFGGEGPPVLLLHGHPRTSATWHRVAPLLVDRGFTVVCPDLRGYGRSRGPAFTADHSGYSKRAVAGDAVAVMRSLGHDRFLLAGHDRGGAVALRLVLDHPDAVSRVAFLDCLPISEHLSRITAKFAARWWHWFFFAQPDTPERVINADPDSWYSGDPRIMGQENHDEWREAVRNPDVVRAMLEDYRAGLTIDKGHEEADKRAGVRIGCPTLALWSLRDDLEDLYGDPLEIWRLWAPDVRGHGIDSGHHVAEQAPDELAASLGDFFVG